MIRFEEIDNTKKMLCCNVCCRGSLANSLYNVELISDANSKQVIRLCKACAKELKESIKFKEEGE